MRQLRKDNNGSTLLLVIIAMCFIGILGSLILSLTMTNVQMKQMDYQAKNNFYQTETVMNELRVGLEALSSQCMYKAYDYLLLHYAEITQDTSTSLKAEFDKKYIENLVPALCGATVIYNPSGGTYYYQPSVLKGFFLDTNLQSKKDDIILYADSAMDTNTLEINLDTTNPDKINSVTLKNIKVKYYDDQGFETRITTDINLESPNLNFEDASIYPEFTKYALIADNQLLAQGGIGMKIEGNIYAGIGGIKVDATNVTTPNMNVTNGYNLKINGDTLVTRGDFTVHDFAKVFVGDYAINKKVNIWAENIKTTGNSAGIQSSYLNINGNCKIADDLMLGAKRSEVIISGSYNGYNYNKTNTKMDDSKIKSEVNSNYSSAILINGINSSLDMSNVTSLTVAGRAFVSRKNEAGKTVVDDIMTGESISIKSNQLSYLVPNDYMWFDHNPVMQSEADTIPIGKKPVNIPVVSGTMSDLLTSQQYVEYHYLMGGTVPMIYYYLEFKNQACANQYFRDYYNHAENQTKIKSNAESYLYGDGIKLSGSLLLAANGLKSLSDGSLALTGGVLANPDTPNDNLLNDAIRTAKEYKSRQLSLVATSAAGNSGDFRLDKATIPLFKTIISQYDNGTPSDFSDDISVIEKETQDDSIAIANGFTKYNGNYFKRIPIDINNDNIIDNHDYSVYIIRNDSDINTFDITTATASSSLQNGIIISTGNINMLSSISYEGLIISGGIIKMMADGISITSQPDMVQTILSYALEKEKLTPANGGWYGLNTMKFTHYFTDYSSESTGVEENIDQVDISRYITYENWKKNVY